LAWGGTPPAEQAVQRKWSVKHHHVVHRARNWLHDSVEYMIGLHMKLLPSVWAERCSFHGKSGKNLLYQRK